MESDDNDDAVATAVFEAEMDDLDSMELVDRKITAATILGVDITEVYVGASGKGGKAIRSNRRLIHGPHHGIRLHQGS